MSAQISTPETNGAIPGAPGPPAGTKRGTAAYVIGAKDLNPSWVMLYVGTLALQFCCAFIRAMVAYVILWLAFTIGRHSTAPVNTLALVVAYGPLVLSFATLILPLGGWWWEQQSGGRSPSERERLVFEDAITSLTYHDPDLRPPRRWFVTDEQEQKRRASGEHALVHRCHRHKERNVCDLLPERDRQAILARIRGAWALKDPDLAEQRLELLASELERTWPDAAASLREGMAETLTLNRLGIGGQLAKTLCSTNPCESMIEIVRHTQRNVKCWQDGDMRKRWTAAGMLVAEQQFRRIIGYRDLAKLITAIERHATRTTHPDPTTITHHDVPQIATV